MLPRRLSEAEIEYGTLFDKSGAAIFTPDEPEPKSRYLKLLQDAIDRGSPLTIQELEDFFGKEDFAEMIELFADLYLLARDELLERLQ